MNTLLLVLFMMAIVTISALMINRTTMKNISATKEIENLKAQAALIDEKNAAESRYRILVEQSPDPIFLTTRKKMLMINHSFEKLFGYQQHEVCDRGFSFLQLIDSSSVDKFQNELKVFVKQRRGYSFITVTMKNKSGEPLEVEISLVRFLLSRRVVYQGIIHDITRTKLLERERERKKHLALIGEMAARVAHEIKNPLASIQTGIQLLESQVSTNDKQKSYYERLRGEIQRVDSILKGLLSYAREDSLNVKSVAIAPVIRRFQYLIEPTIQKHDLGFEVSIEEGLPQLSIDEQKIEQVLWNICLNAIQASREGRKIYLTVQKNGAGIDLKIRDEGSGIPENQMNKIFTPFYSTRVHGSGLGLAISKKIVELHNGHIRVESEIGTGTTVIIQLPENRAL